MAQDNNKRTKADRDLLGQLNAVADAIKAHESKLIDHLPGGNWEDVGQEPEACTDIELFNFDLLEARVDEVRRGSEAVLKAELAKARSLGPLRQVAKPPSRSALDQLKEDFPHFESVLKLAEERTAVSDLIPGRPYKLPPILLAGDPGVGKTAFAEALAATLAQPIKRIDIAASSAGFAISGSHQSWSSAKHGEVWALLQHHSASGVLLLDELDKAANSNFPVLGSLYSLLEPVSARHFVDEYIQVPVDASRLTIIATCNDLDEIEPALLSRFQLFEIPRPTPEQIPAIARSVYAQLHARESWGAVYPETLPEEVLAVLGTYTPRELSGLLQGAVAHAAVRGRRRLLREDVVAQSKAIAERRRRGKAKQHIGFL